MKYTLILGGTGFIGLNLTYEFLSREENVIIYSKNIHQDNLKDLERKVLLVEGNLNQTNKIDNLFEKYNIERVVHLVSTILPSSTSLEFINEYENVVIPTIKILEILKRHHVKKFVFLSSGGTIYGQYKKNGIYKETDELKPINYYGLSKAQLEKLIIFECKQKEINYLILRPSNPFGKYQNPMKKQGLIPILVDKVINEEIMEIWGDGNIIRDYIPVELLVKYIVDIIQKNFKNEIFNLASGKGYSINEIINLVEQVSNKKVKKKYLPMRNVDAEKVILNINKIQENKISRKIDMEEEVRKFFLTSRGY